MCNEAGRSEETLNRANKSVEKDPLASVAHARLEVLAPDVEVVVPLHQLFAVSQLLLELTLHFGSRRRGQERQGEESGLHCWVKL